MLNLAPLWISLRIAAIATIVTFFIGIAAAHLMHHYRGRWRSLLDSILLAPMVLPPTVLGFLLLIFLGKNGPLGVLFTNLGISVVFTWYAAVITATVVALPLMYKTTLGAFEQIDSNLQQAARTLGASELIVFWRITLPLALPSLIAGATLAFARALGEFGATLMLAGNIPGRTQTLPMAIYFAVEGGDFREAAVWTGVILTVALGGLVLVNRWQPRPGNRVKRRENGWKLRDRDAGGADLKETPVSYPLMPRSTHLSADLPTLSVNLTKHLPNFTLDVAFSTNEQPLGLLGASGSGKSLILRCLAGIETPDAGRIVLNGRVLFDSEQGINVPICDRKIGILFQNYALFPHLTIAQNVAFGLHRQLSADQMQTIVTEQLAAVHLESLAERYPHELSGGQQQRVALARALASQPEVLLLDEPFSALDTHLRDQIERQLIDRLQSYQGITVLVTHNLEEAYRVCHQLLVLNSGNAIAHGPKHHIFERPHSLRVAQLTGCKNFSPAMAHGTHQVEARHWQCILQTIEPLPSNLSQIGIRAHQIDFLGQGCDGGLGNGQVQDQSLPASVVNSFPCWLAATSETPHRMTLYLKLHRPPTNERDYHLQAEVFKEKWALLKDQPLPWTVHLEPLRLILLADS
ncbi:molybdate abc permease protein [Leptolyngbya sp. Heron Island J]|uniref:molybdate ABC transporter permease subunit n=1 Tax=Leptolyngbya sp. Heron Island J TaxID=1385935 RepID=UPI0003B981D8|nr:molybdate ABC transporter permease subunit [Leptolyngbya sp. Heron Island J]ESA32417.1 molybdate abc permease protein [Leptolyngbya sp. Heron Island J]